MNEKQSFALRPTVPGRFKSFGLAILYVALAIGLLFGIAKGLAGLGLLPSVKGSDLTWEQSLLKKWGEVGAPILALVILALVGREPISRFGFRSQGWWRDLPIGSAAGFALLAIPVAILAAVGNAHIGSLALAPGQILRSAVFYLLLDLGVAVLEESLFRSFFLVQLSRAISFWPAAIVTAILFGLAHGGNVNEAPFGLFCAGVYGLVLAYSFRRSGALWFAIGLHLAYDFSLDFVLGVPDSGQVPDHALLYTTLHGPAWLTGGMVGPEASVLTLAMLVPLLLLNTLRSALSRDLTASLLCYVLCFDFIVFLTCLKDLERHSVSPLTLPIERRSSVPGESSPDPRQAVRAQVRDGLSGSFAFGECLTPSSLHSEERKNGSHKSE